VYATQPHHFITKIDAINRPCKKIIKDRVQCF